MGIKKWSKQIDDIAWLPAADLLNESEAQVSDLLGSMVKIDNLREFLEGNMDPAKALPEGGVIQPPPRHEKGKGGKGRGGKGFKASGMQGKGMPMMYSPGSKG